MKTVLAIVALTGIEAYALHCGIDGIALGIYIGATAGLGGYHFRKSREAAKQ